MTFLVLVDHNGLLRYETRQAETAARLLDSAARLGYTVLRVEAA